MAQNMVSKKEAVEAMLRYLNQLRRERKLNRNSRDELPSDYEAGKEMMLQGIIWEMECLLDGQHGEMSDAAYPLFETLRLS